MKRLRVAVLLSALAFVQQATLAKQKPADVAKSMRAFGAKCDGATDDSTAVERALQDLALHGGTLQVPNATCKVVAILKFHKPAEPWRIIGEGPQAAIMFAGQDTGMYLSDSSVLATIEGIQFLGTSGRHLYIDNSRNLTVRANHFSGGGSIAPSGGARAGVWVQGGGDIVIDGNTFTGNGPKTGPAACTDRKGAKVVCPAGYDFVTNFNYFARTPERSYTPHLTFTHNRIYGSNTLISVAAYNTDYSEFANNDIDGNDAYRNDTVAGAEGGQGYGINPYGNAHVGSGSHNWVATVRSGNVVTTTMTPQSVVPYAIGQWVCLNGVRPVHGSDFNGCFQIARISDSGGAKPQFTWRQNGIDDSLSGQDMVNAVRGTKVIGNKVRNTAGSCIYTQSVIEGEISHNEVEDCAQMMPSTSVPQAGISASGATRVSIVGNTIRRAINVNPVRIPGQSYESDAIAVAMGYGTVVAGNTASDFQNGISIRSGHNVSVHDNWLDGGSNGRHGVLCTNPELVGEIDVKQNTVKNVRDPKGADAKSGVCR